MWHIPCFWGNPGDKECIYFVERNRGQGMKQKPEDCAIMAFSNPSGKFMFQVLWKNKAQLFKKKGLPRDPSPNSTVGWISLVHGHLGTSIPSTWSRRAAVSVPGPEQACSLAHRDCRPQIALRCSNRSIRTGTRVKRNSSLDLSKGKYGEPCVVCKPD